MIWRRQRESIITVQADVVPTVQAATVSQQLAPAIARYVSSLPASYRIAEGGTIEEFSPGNASIFAVAPLMLLVMVSLLIAQLRSFSRHARS